MPAEIIRACASQYKRDVWEGQPLRIEVWVEKQALESVVHRAAEPFRVPVFSCKGYVSASELWRASRRIQARVANTQATLILYLGDHDPSGLDMTRDITDRLGIFGVGSTTIVLRIALNMDQIRQYDPPPNPAKISDSRFQGYVRQWGDESWELDALDPSVLHSLVTHFIKSNIEAPIWEEALEQEAVDVDKLHEVTRMLERGGGE